MNAKTIDVPLSTTFYTGPDVCIRIWKNFFFVSIYRIIQMMWLRVTCMKAKQWGPDFTKRLTLRQLISNWHPWLLFEILCRPNSLRQLATACEERERQTLAGPTCGIVSDVNRLKGPATVSAESPGIDFPDFVESADFLFCTLGLVWNSLCTISCPTHTWSRLTFSEYLHVIPRPSEHQNCLEYPRVAFESLHPRFTGSLQTGRLSWENT